LTIITSFVYIVEDLAAEVILKVDSELEGNQLKDLSRPPSGALLSGRWSDLKRTPGTRPCLIHISLIM